MSSLLRISSGISIKRNKYHNVVVKLIMAKAYDKENAADSHLQVEDLNDDDEAIKTLRDVNSHNVEDLDLLVGMTAEKKFKCFAISKTSFFIFLLTASSSNDDGGEDEEDRMEY
ncbi:putative GTP-binding protein lepa [Capsicum annuum]|uniref:Uncharacterized protein n=1 Tax=Capsicum annuum TaxID=4072 RepID=A0A2G2ZMU5_CAPAN|nr:putative GTP-binding protein lepa [Capsicum annuum]PHT83312.1 hypothetical protein T459_11755 [Capsicum annuum]